MTADERTLTSYWPRRSLVYKAHPSLSSRAPRTFTPRRHVILVFLFHRVVRETPVFDVRGESLPILAHPLLCSFREAFRHVYTVRPPARRLRRNWPRTLQTIRESSRFTARQLPEFFCAETPRGKWTCPFAKMCESSSDPRNDKRLNAWKRRSWRELSSNKEKFNMYFTSQKIMLLRNFKYIYIRIVKNSAQLFLR